MTPALARIDLVATLRNFARQGIMGKFKKDVLVQAADEIEGLRAALAKAQVQVCG